MTPHHILPFIPHLRRYARALVGTGAADDLVQDTLERAVNKFTLWQPGSNLRAWLFSVMHNVHVNQVRARRETDPLDAALEIPVRATQSDGLELRDLSRALAALPLEQREVLLLVALEGMRYEEVAQTLGLPVGTVMSRLSRGRERLRALLDGAANKPELKVVK